MDGSIVENENGEILYINQIIANMHLGLLEVDNEENIVFANQRFTDISGYEFAELKGKKPSRFLLTPEDRTLMDSKHKKWYS